eukprot:6717921-Prymnesium_polylepis.1
MAASRGRRQPLARPRLPSKQSSRSGRGCRARRMSTTSCLGRRRATSSRMTNATCLQPKACRR